MDSVKKLLCENIENQAKDLVLMSDNIFDKPEISFQEKYACSILTDYLQKEGFDVITGIGSLETAFKATYTSGSGGVRIGLLCEYDALKNMGHGCGHHMQGPAILGAAVAIKEILNDKNYELIVYGTPGEEGTGGKVIMIENGCFQDIDFSLMCHAGPATQIDIKSLARAKITMNFHGKSSHAAFAPDQGRSAVDALLLAINGVEFLREHVRDDTRMHFSIDNAGGPANVVPSEASATFLIRSLSGTYLKTLLPRLDDIAKGAALMTGTTGEMNVIQCLDAKIPSYTLNEVLMDNAKLINAPSLKGAREKTGSTDFGNVTNLIPSACIRFAFVPDGSSAHSQIYLDAGKSEDAHNGMLNASKILAMTVFDLLENPDKLEEAKKEFEDRKKKGDLDD